MTHSSAPTHQVAWRFSATEPTRLASWLAAARMDGRRIVDASARDLLDIYLETDDWRLFRAGYALRLRRTTTHAPAATQYEARLEPLVASAVECSAPLADAQTTTVREVPGELGHRVRRLAGRKPLHALCEVHATREIYLIEEYGEILAALNVDAITMPMRGERGPVRSHGVEVQIRPADHERLEALVAEMQQECELTLEGTPPFERALAARGIEPLRSPALGSTAIRLDMAIAPAAYAVLRTQFALLWQHESATRLGEDIEALHQMRVAVRRLRAALRLFDDVLPARRQEWFSEELHWLGGVLGTVRDLDVQGDNLRQHAAALPEPERAAMEGITADLNRRRAAFQEQLVQELDSERYARLMAVGALTLQRGVAPRTRAARLPVAASVPRRIRRRRRAVRNQAAHLGVGSSAVEMHALRIRCKRLRYAVEFFADVYGKPAKSFAHDLAAIQDVLGLQQDAVVAVALRDEIIAGAGTSPESIAAFEAFVQEVEQRAASERLRLDALMRAVDGKPWKRLRRAMRRRREEARAAMAEKAKPARRREPPTSVPPGRAPSLDGEAEQPKSEVRDGALAPVVQPAPES